ncbi:DUF885 domain-containing protein [Massilia eurypsychrophila]|uniref:DUF885 domain-containing protein n=1 Tax=Massilia eurypsychrophila TaxID=1485217 RepID=A0A2G8TM11_9BURK|nr:DUF885 domain-containing protein [Massilia eurypsychrophila]PIL47087.1 DUF885 domain-containing protein [Massilia eurypsychrophila]
MMKTKIALAVLLATFALAPASAAKEKKSNKPTAGKVAKAAPGKSANAGKGGKAAKATPKAASKAEQAPAPASGSAEPASDRRMDSTSMQFLTAQWRLDPEAAIRAGKYDGAANLTIPNSATRAARITFADDWLKRFARFEGRSLSDKQRTDLALLVNKLQADRFQLTTLREHEWNPAMYNIAEPIDLILTTEYAAKPQRLRTLLKRLANVPAYYQAAQASIVNPTHEHTQLAIAQAPGTITVLADLGKAAQESILTAQEKAIFAQRIANAGSALIGYIDFLAALDRTQQQKQSARPFRIGKALYEQKFAFDIQAAGSAEQTYQKALAAREELLTRMDGLADQLWAKTMGSAAKPQDRTRKIGMVIDKLSANHVARENFFPEIRRQIGVLQEWVVKNNLLTLDPKRPLEVRETPLYQRGIAGASIDAPGPYRPQDRTFYNVTPLDALTAQDAESTLREYNHWILQILNIHEAVPGHYAQLVYANKSPSMVKSLFGNGAMVEGWAVYAERMMLESGYGDNAPEMWLMYSKWNLRVVTNTILDYSVHVNGMTQAQAMDLLVRQAFQTNAEASEKWRRVQLSSVQLTSYFSGYSEIMELREQRKQALGPKFALKEFHEQFLSYGNAPVKVIRELMQ